MNIKEIKELEKYLNVAREVRLLELGSEDPRHQELIEKNYLGCLPDAEALLLSFCGDLGISVIWDYKHDKYILRGNKT